ncbi:MAG: hypothetical protein WC766_04340 [Patescibacteria group bacterium]|jgi:hypothetical protein
MEGLFLNIKDRNQLVDFLAEWSGFASTETQQKSDELVRAYDEGEKTDKTELVEFVTELAKEVWSVRFALTRFFKEEGALIEWDRVLQAVSKSTAHLMERFRKDSGCGGVDCVLDHEDVDMTLHDDERHEIEKVRHHLMQDYWTSHPKTLEPLLEEGRELQKGYEKRLSDLQALTDGWPALLAEEVNAKVKSYQDEIYFKGNVVPLQTLDEELAYYTEQKELPVE